MGGVAIHPERLRARAGDACANRRRRGVVKRFLSLALLCVATFLAGCKTPQGTDVQPSSGLIRAGQDIVIKELRTYATSDAVAFSNDQYYVARFTFTNNLGFALKPRIDHFVIEDLRKVRYLGVDSGSAALVGISNYDGVLQRGEAHDYTVGFRVPLNAQGLLFYDATF
ncbi:MAG: hypothetical protein NVSMB19_09470 [Vulcanimicrobiaceae bacterium]